LWYVFFIKLISEYHSTVDIPSTDELFKSSAYLTEAYLLNTSTKYSRGPKHTPFNLAFQTDKGYFGWLEEEEGEDEEVER
jgi:hypothetical protein